MKKLASRRPPVVKPFQPASLRSVPKPSGPKHATPSADTTPARDRGPNWRDQTEDWVPPSHVPGFDVQSPMDTARKELKKISPTKFEPIEVSKHQE